MNKNKVFHLFFLFALLTAACVAAFAQTSDSGIREEMRPFDFSDKHYGENGVEARMIYDRRNGSDKYSIFDINSDPKFCPVRVIGTSPAYDSTGNLVFWTMNGELYDESFTPDSAGKQAYEIANMYPMFVFPSITVWNSNRQAVLIDTYDGYFDKNPLGLSVVVFVEFTAKGMTWEDPIMKKLVDLNGESLDGTPIIRTKKQLDELTRRGLVSQRVKRSDGTALPPFQIAPVIRNPEKGTIAPDAYLMTVLRQNGKPLVAEEFIIKNFGCLKLSGQFCPE